MDNNLKTGLLCLVAIGSYSMMKRKSDDDEDKEKNKELENKFDIEKLKYHEGRDTNKSKINKKFIEKKINEAILNLDTYSLQEAIKYLDEFIDGYEVLDRKINNLNILNIQGNIRYLKNLRIKAHNNLGCLYQKENNIDEANKNYLKSLDYCDFSNSSHIKIIKKNMTLLINNDYII